MQMQGKLFQLPLNNDLVNRIKNIDEMRDEEEQWEEWKEEQWYKKQHDQQIRATIRATGCATKNIEE